MNQASPAWDTIHIGGKGILTGGLIILVPLYLFAPFAVVQFICILLLFILVTAKIYSAYLVRHIQISRRDSEFRIFRYEWVQIELKIENRGLLPAFMLVIEDSPGPLPIFRNNKMLCALGRRSWTLFTWQGHCTNRGEFTIGPAAVRGADPLGLFPFHLTAHETSRLFVYPVFCSITLNPSKGIPLGSMISGNPLYEDITRRRSLRPYQSGDEPRRINWKVSARMSHTGQFMVNEYDATASYPMMIFLNGDRHEYPIKSRGVFIERIIEAAAAICLKAAYERQELGIILYTSAAEGGTSVIAPAAGTVVPILERLAALDWSTISLTPENSDASRGSVRAMLDQGKRLPYGTRFLYTGPDMGDEAYVSLNTLKKYHLSLEYLIIDERSLPALVPGNSPRYRVKEMGNEII